MAYVTIEKPIDHVSLITLNRPERMNAMSFDTVGPLYEAFASVAADNDTHCVILTGAGKGFCAGLDLEDHGVPPNAEGLTMSRIAIRAMEYMSDLVPTMRAMPQPVIAAINGPAYGGGMCLPLGADIRIASSSARFRSAGVTNGLAGTELGVSYLLPRLIGASRAFEMILSGRVIESAEALESGLVSRVVPDEELLPAALALAEQITGWSAHGVAMTKKILWSNLEAGSLTNAIDCENRNQLLVRLTTENLAEAIRARREGRKPDYKD
ncbi:MAG: enoyl-CoA hydratase-related protein [Candidatus Binatia bacterium]|nr:enoyl-CoA hydratase-related protein [Candidatus Binatia bacterium]MDG2010169.1 enoyl-CoA hydratase-related protein [Candidatus Binatia bacterium]HAC79992.1 enoyl-CoA hydratase [Deltaproteobacteria bacterium]